MGGHPGLSNTVGRAGHSCGVGIPTRLADMHLLVAVVVEFVVIELAGVVEFDVIELAMATADACASAMAGSYSTTLAATTSSPTSRRNIIK